jgi:hypothetical protein
MMSARTLVPFLVLIGVACDGPSGVLTPPEELPPELAHLAGEWRWVRSCCGLAGDAVTPDSLGVAVSLRFRQEGTVEMLKNGEAVLQSIVTVRRGWTHQPDADVTVVRYQPALDLVPGMVPAAEQQPVMTGADSLLLVSPCADCYGLWRFVRMGS